MSREREGERWREWGIWEKGGRGSEREREREREREGRAGNVYNLCSFCHNVFRKGGEFRGDKFRYGNSKIHIKTIE